MKDYTVDLGQVAPWQTEQQSKDAAVATLTRQGKNVIDAYPIPELNDKFGESPRDLWCVVTDEPADLAGVSDTEGEDG